MFRKKKLMKFWNLQNTSQVWGLRNDNVNFSTYKWRCLLVFVHRVIRLPGGERAPFLQLILRLEGKGSSLTKTWTRSFGFSPPSCSEFIIGFTIGPSYIFSWKEEGSPSLSPQEKSRLLRFQITLRLFIFSECNSNFQNRGC